MASDDQGARLLADLEVASPRIGFCCKWVDMDGLPDPSMNQRTTTLKSLLAMPPLQRGRKIEAIVEHNISALRRQLEWLVTQPPGMRLFRITSKFVPASSHPEFEDIHSSKEFRNLLESGLGWVRPFADKHGIRLCMHPGQFTNLCSPPRETDEREGAWELVPGDTEEPWSVQDKMSVVDRAVADIEHHTDLAVLMGYGTGWHPSGFAINVHGNVRQDPLLQRFRFNVLERMSQEARNLLTIENDEFSCGVDDLISSGIGDVVPLVLDIHHHWIRSAGENILPSDPRIRTFEESWRGTRPLSHASLSSESIIGNWPSGTMPDYAVLAARGLKPSLLRGHSRLIWNTAAMDWISAHLAWTDIEIEAKGKNAASRGVWAHAQAAGILGGFS